jgi:hypothetical protein
MVYWLFWVAVGLPDDWLRVIRSYSVCLLVLSVVSKP